MNSGDIDKSTLPDWEVCEVGAVRVVVAVFWLAVRDARKGCPNALEFMQSELAHFYADILGVEHAVLMAAVHSAHKIKPTLRF